MCLKIPCWCGREVNLTACVCEPPGGSLIGNFAAPLPSVPLSVNILCVWYGISTPWSSRGCVALFVSCTEKWTSLPGGYTFELSNVSVTAIELGFCDVFEKNSRKNCSFFSSDGFASGSATSFTSVRPPTVIRSRWSAASTAAVDLNVTTNALSFAGSASTCHTLPNSSSASPSAASVTSPFFAVLRPKVFRRYLERSNWGSFGLGGIAVNLRGRGRAVSNCALKEDRRRTSAGSHPHALRFGHARRPAIAQHAMCSAHTQDPRSRRHSAVGSAKLLARVVPSAASRRSRREISLLALSRALALASAPQLLRTLF